jgi:glyoxylase-like metal-dependent hydrolase (beta-lactamase superfamily II)
MSLFLRQICDEKSKSLSYVLADSYTRKAAIIDSLQSNLDDYLQILQDRGLLLEYILETHVHEDHVSAMHELRKHTGARRVVHENAGMTCSEQTVRDGDEIYLGELTLQVLHTPGHSPCSVTYCVEDRLFVGDALWSGNIAPFVKGVSNPKSLFSSVKDIIYAYPDDYILYPGHSWLGQRISSIAQEKYCNRVIPDNCEYDGFLREASEHNQTIKNAGKYRMQNLAG